MENLKSIINKIENSFRKLDANAGSFYYGDIYNLNHIQEVKYPALVVTNDTHEVNDMLMKYNFNIFYVERLTANKANKIDVHATAIRMLNSILQDLDNEYIIGDNYQIITFEEKFNDVCAGAYTKVSMELPLDLCTDVAYNA